jgi:hypothetical protein
VLFALLVVTDAKPIHSHDPFEELDTLDSKAIGAAFSKFLTGRWDPTRKEPTERGSLGRNAARSYSVPAVSSDIAAVLHGVLKTLLATGFAVSCQHSSVDRMQLIACNTCWTQRVQLVGRCLQVPLSKTCQGPFGLSKMPESDLISVGFFH